MMRNERIRLLVTLLNTMANASYTVGIAAPVALRAEYFVARHRDRRRHLGGRVVVLHGLAQLVVWGIR